MANEIARLVKLATDVKHAINGKLQNTAGKLCELVDGVVDLDKNNIIENKIDGLREVFMWSKDTTTILDSLTKISATLEDMISASISKKI